MFLTSYLAMKHTDNYFQQMNKDLITASVSVEVRIRWIWLLALLLSRCMYSFYFLNRSFRFFHWLEYVSSRGTIFSLTHAYNLQRGIFNVESSILIVIVSKILKSQVLRHNATELDSRVLNRSLITGFENGTVFTERWARLTKKASEKFEPRKKKKQGNKEEKRHAERYHKATCPSLISAFDRIGKIKVGFSYLYRV